MHEFLEQILLHGFRYTDPGIDDVKAQEEPGSILSGQYYMDTDRATRGKFYGITDEVQ